MAKTAIGTTMIAIMQREDIQCVMWGDAWVIGSCFIESGTKAKNDHPMTRMKVVLDALSRDERFEQWFVKIDLFYRECWNKRLVRCFKLKLAQ